MEMVGLGRNIVTQCELNIRYTSSAIGIGESDLEVVVCSVDVSRPAKKGGK